MIKKKKSLDQMTDKELEDLVLTPAFKVPTSSEVERLAARLHKKARAKDIELGKRCTHVKRCGLLSCPVCRRSQQLMMMAEHADLPKKAGHSTTKKGLRSITIIPQYGETHVGELPEGGLRKFKRRIRRDVLKCAPGFQGLLCVDVSWNIGMTRRECWQWHVHGIFGNITQREYKAIKSQFGQIAGRADRPVLQRKVYDVTGQLAYMFKSNFFGRKNYQKTGERRNTSKFILSIQQELKLAEVLCRLKVSQRRLDIGTL